MTFNKTPDLITIVLITSLQTISLQLENANYEITPSFTVQKKLFPTYTEESQLVIFILNKIESIFSCISSNPNKGMYYFSKFSSFLLFGFHFTSIIFSKKIIKIYTLTNILWTKINVNIQRKDG